MLKRKNWANHGRSCSPTLDLFRAPAKDICVTWFDPRCHGRAVWFVQNCKHKARKSLGMKKLRYYNLWKPEEAERLLDSLHDVMEHKKNDKIHFRDVHNKINPPWVSAEPAVIEIWD